MTTLDKRIRPEMGRFAGPAKRRNGTLKESDEPALSLFIGSAPSDLEPFARFFLKWFRCLTMGSESA
jgi:hypothetical protein